MARKTDYTGDSIGEWFVESKAPAVDGKRFWRCVNKRTDETRVVAQTALKDLVNDSGDDVPSSADITARVLVGNFKDDPFNLPDGILPDDDTEYPFEVSFVEPVIIDEKIVNGTWVENEDHRGFRFVPSDEEPDDDDDSQLSIDDLDDPGFIEGAEEFVADWVAPRDNYSLETDPQATGSPWESTSDELRKQIAVAMELAADLKDALDRILKASLVR